MAESTRATGCWRALRTPACWMRAMSRAWRRSTWPPRRATPRWWSCCCAKGLFSTGKANLLPACWRDVFIFRFPKSKEKNKQRCYFVFWYIVTLWLDFWFYNVLFSLKLLNQTCVKRDADLSASRIKTSFACVSSVAYSFWATLFAVINRTSSLSDQVEACGDLFVLLLCVSIAITGIGPACITPRAQDTRKPWRSCCQPTPSCWIKRTRTGYRWKFLTTKKSQKKKSINR